MIKRILMLVGIVVVLAGCDRVPPGYKAKIVSSSGYSQEIKEPGKYKMWGSEELVLLETATQTMSVPMVVKMADDLDLEFSVNFRTRAVSNEKVLNSLFNDITYDVYEMDGESVKIISLKKVYGVYGADVLKNISRSVVGKYRVSEINANYDKINDDLQIQLRNAMKNNPLEVSNVTLADVKWPKVITDAIEKQQERELAIKTEENEQAIAMVKKTNQLAQAQADRQIELTRATTIRDQNRLISEGINPNLLAYKALEVQEKMAENDNAVFVPYESLNQPGLSNRIYSK